MEKNNDWGCTTSAIISVIVSTVIYIATDMLILSTIIGFVIAGVLYLIFESIDNAMHKEEREEIKRKNKEYKIKEDKIAFIKECKKNDIRDIQKTKDIEKAKVIAGKYGYTDDVDFSTFYSDAKACYDDDCDEKSKKAREKRISELTQKEKDLYDRLTQFSDLSGRKKRVAMLEKEQSVYLAELNKLKGFQNNVHTNGNILMEKEKSWGTAGGVASAIAGPAAGLAAASSVMRENEAIKNRNTQTASFLADAYIAADKKISALQEKVDFYEDLIDEAQIKLVGKETSEQVLQMLDISTLKPKISDTGAITVDVKFRLKEKAVIFEDVSAIADGVAKAEFYQNEKLVGSAALVFPLDGVSEKEIVKVSCICLSGGDKNMPVDVKIAPGNLCLIEE